MKRATLAVLLVLSFACADRLAAQSSLEPLLLRSVGATSGQALFATHMAVNTLGDAWMAKAYEDKTALQLAGGYEGGLKAMMENINELQENGKGLSDSDQKFLTGIVEGCQLISAQITAFKGVVKTGDRTKAEIFESKRKEAQAKIFGLLGIPLDDDVPATAGGPGPSKLAFEIIQATAPNGKAGQLGKVEFERPAEGKVFTAGWKYANGGTDQGIGVPFPDSGVIAVGFGPDVLGVAIYKRSTDGKNVSARWANYAPGSEIGTYEMTQGDDDSEYNIEGGGKIVFDMGKSRTAKVTWKLPIGTYSGIAVAEGDYLAAISIKPGGKAGVAIYTADVKTGTASGRWIMTGASGVGEELYKLTSAEGGSAGATPGNPVSEVKAIAQTLLDKGPKALAQMRPSAEQISALAATAEDATQLALYVEKLYNSLGEVNQLAKPGQTEINVFTGDDLPGGYTQQAAHLKPGLAIYGFEFLEPGEKNGMSYDGVVNVGGTWVMIPKMWRAFDK